MFGAVGAQPPLDELFQSPRATTSYVHSSPVVENSPICVSAPLRRSGAVHSARAAVRASRRRQPALRERSDITRPARRLSLPTARRAVNRSSCSRRREDLARVLDSWKSELTRNRATRPRPNAASDSVKLWDHPRIQMFRLRRRTPETLRVPASQGRETRPRHCAGIILEHALLSDRKNRRRKPGPELQTDLHRA